jgi:hypothetical protein
LLSAKAIPQSRESVLSTKAKRSFFITSANSREGLRS